MEREVLRQALSPAALLVMTMARAVVFGSRTGKLSEAQALRLAAMAQLKAARAIGLVCGDDVPRDVLVRAMDSLRGDNATDGWWRLDPTIGFVVACSLDEVLSTIVVDETLADEIAEKDDMGRFVRAVRRATAELEEGEDDSPGPAVSHVLAGLSSLELTSGDFLVPLARGLTFNSTLLSLKIADADDLDVLAELVRALIFNKSLTRLDMSGAYDLGEAGALLLCRVLQFNHTLACLDLSGCDIGPNAVAPFCAALGSNLSLTSLDLSWNPIGNDGVRSIADALAGNTILTRIDLRSVDIDAVGMARLASGLERNAVLRHLNLRGNDGINVAPAFGRAIAVNSTLDTLDLAETGISARGIAGLARGVASSASLIRLNLRCNPLVDVTGLARAVAACSTLVELDLARCGIRAGCEALARAVASHPSLRRLNLRRNPIAAGTASLATALATNCVLVELDLGMCGVELAHIPAIVDALRSNTTLAVLDLSRNELGDVGVALLGSGLVANRSLVDLDLGHAGITAVGADHLSRTLSANHTLRLRGHDVAGVNVPQMRAGAALTRFWVRAQRADCAHLPLASLPCEVVRHIRALALTASQEHELSFFSDRSHHDHDADAYHDDDSVFHDDERTLCDSDDEAVSDAVAIANSTPVDQAALEAALRADDARRPARRRPDISLLRHLSETHPHL